MKIALLAVLGLVLGALGGAALSIGAGLAWVEIFKTTNFEGYSGMRVFFTFMPLGAAAGGLGGALLFGLLAARDAAIAIEREPVRCDPRKATASVQCRIAHCFPFKFTYLERQIMSAATARRRMTPQNAVAVLSRFGKTAMTEHSLWRFSRALHGAINQRQLHDLDDLIDEDVQWAIYGPIDMFPFLGARRGKPAVLEVIRQISENFQLHRFDRETIMLGTDTAASILRYSLTALDSNKPISVRLAHFAQFKTGRLASIRVVVDTFDLVEQVLGQPIHLPKMG